MKLIPQSCTDFKKYIESLEDLHPEDRAEISEWLSLKSLTFFKDKTVEDLLAWIPDNLRSDLTELRAKKSFESAAGVPSESDLEDALSWTESISQGSEKQIKWAKSIAQDNLMAIALASKKNIKIPTDAKWWIDNRESAFVSLMALATPSFIGA